ncbi:MAG: UDP-N-acetylmuramoylalanyl-D-glutamyl-2, 6-diaminopimelate--D-alanyl-D-alanine ligase, partial [Acidimicrobiales bacterium]|nr:UDP-N-acetylmuramoylalanyl-D-glutamyl-2, 6-diaminopimelate--D-alanyl-D-alanine ligase [Acidimicrobiales bacterium]
YNANPTSMAAALDALAELAATRRFAVVGTMAELGPDGPTQHRDVAARAEELGIHLVAVAEPAYGVDGPDAVASSVGAVDRLRALGVGDGDVVLVKASRSAGLEAVADGLVALAD